MEGFDSSGFREQEFVIEDPIDTPEQREAAAKSFTESLGYTFPRGANLRWLLGSRSVCEARSEKCTAFVIAQYLPEMQEQSVGETYRQIDESKSDPSMQNGWEFIIETMRQWHEVKHGQETQRRKG